MTVFKAKMNLIWLVGILVAAIMACGGGESTDEAKAQTTGTGSLAFNIVYEIDPDIGSNRRPLAFKSCREINKVTAQVFDGAGTELSVLHTFDCDARHGTIKNVAKGTDRQVVVRGVWMDDEDDYETVFYEGRATGLTIDAGKTTFVDALVARFREPEDPEQLEELMSLADRDNDGYTKSDGDCDDSDPERHPDADELCNMVDDNCNGMADEPYQTFYIDSDGDGFGTELQTLEGCTAPIGWAQERTEGMDCDDTKGAVYPGATEVLCDGVDNDCDGEILCEMPEGTYFRDYDGDGFGDQQQYRQGPAEGYVDNSTDCDDTKSDVNPGIDEICNGRDDDCDGQVDEGLLNDYHPDDDKDGYGDMNQTTKACMPSAGYILDGSDCNDGNGNIHPDLQELYNGIDDNCDGQVDEGYQWYRTYGGNGMDKANAIIPGNNGGYVIAGSSESYISDGTTEYAWIVKIDENGNEQWNRTCGITNRYGFNMAFSVFPGNDGGYIISGTTNEGTLGNHQWLSKIDENGDEQWCKTYGNSGDFTTACIVTMGKNGGYVLACDRNHSVTSVIKIDEDGNEQWNQWYELGVNSMTPGNNGGYIILWYDAVESFISKIDENGNELWRRTDGSSGCSIISGNNGGYIIAGGWSISKIDENGSELWYRTYGSNENYNAASSIISGNNGGYYVIAGDIWPFDEKDYPYSIIKLDENGNEQWNQSFGDAKGISHMTKSRTGGYVITGNTIGDIWAMKIDENGNGPI